MRYPLEGCADLFQEAAVASWKINSKSGRDMSLPYNSATGQLGTCQPVTRYCGSSTFREAA